jgi:NADPH:quinone reductase-like Zn-dependent oxidoreductase
MKAFALTSADQSASIIDIPEPALESDGVKVRLGAASVNGFDVFQANGSLIAMMEHVLPTVIGRDFAGVVAGVGSERSDVAVGDRVLGFIPSTPPLHDGTYAEVVATPAAIVAPVPAEVSIETAAAIPLAGATALDSVDAVALERGETVLVAGATGGVGSFAVQLAAQRGATVIATAKPGEEDGFVRSLGATETVDYTAGDVTDVIRARFPDGVDVLIDLVSRDDAFTRMVGLVAAGGRVATTLGAADVDGLAARDIRATNIVGSPTVEKLSALAAQVAARSLQVRIQRAYPLDAAAAALASFQAGTLGKLVLTVD